MSSIKSTNLSRKIFVFTSGLFIMASGVALSVKADLGISPVSCAPYVFSLKVPLTMGVLTIIQNILFISIQIILLRKNYRLFQLIQLPAVFAFGLFIDLSLNLLSVINTSSYTGKLLLCLLSCVILALGIFLIVKAGITYMPGEGLAMAIIEIFHTDFGKTKVGIDSLMVVLGIICSLILLGRLEGIREGTIASALFVGFLIRFYNSKFPVLDKWLNNCSEEKTAVCK